MSFSHTEASYEHQSCLFKWIFLYELGGGEQRRSQRGVKVSVEFGKFTVLVTFGDAGCGQQGLGTILQFAIAAGYATVGAVGDWAPAGAFAFGADFSRDFHVLTLHLWMGFRKCKGLCA